jgi:NADH:ubiquinone reductase (H+-translocating)
VVIVGGGFAGLNLARGLARERGVELTFAVVGGGPTGVELAGAIGEMSRYTLARDFRRIDPTLARVILIEAGPRILTSFSERLATRAVRDLERLGVQVWTSCRVTRVDANGVELGDERLRCATTVWAAGVRPAARSERLGTELDKQGRVRVRADLALPDHAEVFVLGDQAHAIDADGSALPGLAPVALQQGRYLARQIRRELRGQPREAFRYLDKGQLATIGRRRAILQMGRLHMTGFPAWVAWLLVHVYYLVGFRNRLLVVMQWAWAWGSFRCGARLIVEKRWRLYPEAGPDAPANALPPTLSERSRRTATAGERGAPV